MWTWTRNERQDDENRGEAGRAGWDSCECFISLFYVTLYLFLISILIGDFGLTGFTCSDTNVHGRDAMATTDGPQADVLGYIDRCRQQW